MIRIDLVDNTAKLKHVDFRVVPVTTEKDFACIPDGILPLGRVFCFFEEKRSRSSLSSKPSIFGRSLVSVSVLSLHPDPYLDTQCRACLGLEPGPALALGAGRGECLVTRGRGAAEGIRRQ